MYYKRGVNDIVMKTFTHVQSKLLETDSKRKKNVVLSVS